MIDGSLMQVRHAALVESHETGRNMQTKTQRLIVRGGIIVLAALLVSTVGGWAGGTTTDTERAPASGTEVLGELRSLRQQFTERSEEHTSELQSRPHLVCRLLLAKKTNDHVNLCQHG